MKIQLGANFDPLNWDGDCLVLPVGAKLAKGSLAATVDSSCDSLLSRLLKNNDFKPTAGAARMLYRVPGCAAERILLVGVETSTQKADINSSEIMHLNKVMDSLFAALGSSPVKEVAVAMDGFASAVPLEQQLKMLARSAEYSLYRYTATLSKKAKTPKLKNLRAAIPGRATAAAKRALEVGQAIAEGTNLTRELANLPANYCTPKYLSAQGRQMAKKHTGLRCKVLGQKELEELGMGSMLSVSAGSVEPPQLVIVEYFGAAKKSEPPVVLVGKGVTFDTGGISIKPSAAMDEMKFDMCGAATVLGTMHSAAAMSLPLNLIGLVGAVENMPGGKATKPGDVVTSMSGQTIEVLNTDAEGRLVLCDVLHYAKRYKPACIIDIATLTGACVIALGSHASGLLGNSQPLMDELLAAGEACGDRAWQMPMWDEYQKGLKSNFADIANIGGGREAGTVTAACFLSRFTKDLNWAHLDIAGTAWHGGAKKGATGRPVGLLCEFLLRRAAA